ncbi:unnamed protein product [Cylindrotheca closterium]|uniref:Uncharacterized protein n=1 Tax=Cylindrotheca closterium TaxID=2856 RepID=A0AAD2FP30_9STRA|nr:unnamed protein product [Cylindrotheca closterium]
MTWDQRQHRAILEYERDVDLDQQVEKDDNEWIEKLLAAEQASPEFEGTITIDLSMPAAKDMDDRATVGSTIGEHESGYQQPLHRIRDCGGRTGSS